MYRFEKMQSACRPTLVREIRSKIKILSTNNRRTDGLTQAQGAVEYAGPKRAELRKNFASMSPVTPFVVRKMSANLTYTLKPP